MHHLKSLLIALSIFLLVIVGVMFYHFDESYEIKLATEFFLKGETTEVKRLLERLPEERYGVEKYLFLSYALRREEQLGQATQLLQEAKERLLPSHSSHWFFEILVNLCINAFLSKERDTLYFQWKELHANFPQAPLTHWLGGVVAYEEGQYHEVQRLWSLSPQDKLTSSKGISQWLAKSLEQYFPPSWQKLRLLHCDIEGEELLSARRELEKWEREDLTPEEHNFVLLFLGYSYLIEGESKPFSLSLPYYLQAHRYLQQVFFTREINRERSQLAKKFLYWIEQSIQRGEHLLEMKNFFASLHQWGEEYALNEFYQDILHRWLQLLKEEKWTAAEEMEEILFFLFDKKKEHYFFFQKEYQSLLHKSVEEGQIELLKILWKGYWRHFLQKNDPILRHLERKILSKVTSNAPLSDFYLFFDFWNQQERDNSLRYQFTESLLLTALSIWSDPVQGGRIFQLFKLAERIPSLRSENSLGQFLQVILKRAYTLQASKPNSEAPLPYLEEIIDHFGQRESIGVLTAEEIETELLTAEVFLQEERFWEAGKVATWTIEVLGENQKAFEISGKANFGRKDFSSALSWFEKMAPPLSPEIEELIGLCLIHLEEYQRGVALLRELANYHVLREESLLMISYLEAEQGEFSSSISWLKKIQAPEEEALSHLCILSYRVRNWEEMLFYYQQLPFPYDHLLSPLVKKAWREWKREEEGLYTDPVQIEIFSLWKRNLSESFQKFLLPKMEQLVREEEA